MRSARAVRPVVLGLCALLAAQVAAAALDALAPPDMGRAERSSPVALDRRGDWLRALPVEDGRWRIRADLERTDRAFLRRLIAVEDARFRGHFGVDPVAVVRAGADAAAAGRVRSGASTLTMQTARLLEPRPRTFAAKAVEALRAVQIEARLSKREILALYLTLAPYGGNLEGVRAASLAYFGHEPESLTIGEQALLIALPQAPEARRPDLRPEAARAARSAVLRKLADKGLISPGEADEADAEPVPRRAAFPALAWHVSSEALRRAGAGPGRDASAPTTVDAPLQARLEVLAAETARAQGAEAGVSILVVEVESRAVRALVGSAGLDRPGGWIDMTRALRSPGSTLKPFIYAFAFDDGLAAPDTLVEDAPRRFGDYQPENFDRVFYGRVTVREALAHSLNVPAVATLERIGPAAFEGRLAAAGVRLARPGAGLRGPGLALALGGEGVTLRDLAVLYAALAGEGLARPLAFTEAEAARNRSGGVRLMRADTAAKVVDLLRETPAPAGRMPAVLTRGGGGLAFKTGTSYGFRDALAVGIAGGHVIVVWTGRPDGGARGGLTGRDAALPLLFDAVDALAPPPLAPRPLVPVGAPSALKALEARDSGPQLVFPPDGAAVQVEAVGPASRGLVLSARGEGLDWYVDGAPLAPEPASGRVVWRPEAAGFYRVSVVDANGRQAAARVRVRAP